MANRFLKLGFIFEVRIGRKRGRGQLQWHRRAPNQKRTLIEIFFRSCVVQEWRHPRRKGFAQSDRLDCAMA